MKNINQLFADAKTLTVVIPKSEMISARKKLHWVHDKKAQKVIWYAIPSSDIAYSVEEDFWVDEATKELHAKYHMKMGFRNDVGQNWKYLGWCNTLGYAMDDCEDRYNAEPI